MADLQYNFLDNNFTVYEPVETPKVTINYPLSDDPIDAPWASRILDSGTPIVKSNIPQIVNNNPEEQNIHQETDYRVENSQQISGNSLENGRYVINSLMSRLNLSKEQAAGIAGVIMSESGINPSAYNKAEKAGKLKASSANGVGYGAGMLQWSNDRKRTALKLIGREGSNIEDLSLDDQIEMLARELEGPYKNTLLGIRSSKNASEAAATMYCHNVGGFSSSTRPATKSEIDTMNKRYSKFGNNIINRGMSYAESLAKL